MVDAIQETLSALDQTLLDAVRAGDVRGVEEALVQGANANTQYSYQYDRRYVLEIAIQDGNEGVFDALVRHGAELHYPDSSDRNLFHYLAFEHGNEAGTEQRQQAKIRIGRKLVQAGVKVDDVDAYDLSPLMYAISNHASRLARFFIGQGANPGWGPDHPSQRPAQARLRDRPVHRAARMGNEESLWVVALAGGDLTWKNSEQKTVGQLIALSGNSLGKTTAHASLKRSPQISGVSEFAHVNKETLFRPHADKQGMCFLDAPSTWLHAEQWLPVLQARGEGLTKEEVLRPAGHGGISYMDMAVASGQLPALLKHFEQQGVVMTIEDMAKSVNPNAVEWIADYNGLPSWVEHWRQGLSEYALLQQMRQLPPTARDAVPYHQMVRAFERSLHTNTGQRGRG